MTEAPERILSWPWPDKPHQGLWHVSPFDRDGATEFIRLDAHEAAVAAARKEGMHVAASLAAAISLLEKAGKAAKKSAPSDKMFDQMLSDYRKTLTDWRKAYTGASK